MTYNVFSGTLNPAQSINHNHASISPLSFLQAGCPSCHPTNSVKALMDIKLQWLLYKWLILS